MSKFRRFFLLILLLPSSTHSGEAGYPDYGIPVPSSELTCLWCGGQTDAYFEYTQSLTSEEVRSYQSPKPCSEYRGDSEMHMNCAHLGYEGVRAWVCSREGYTQDDTAVARCQPRDFSDNTQLTTYNCIDVRGGQRCFCSSNLCNTDFPRNLVPPLSRDLTCFWCGGSGPGGVLTGSIDVNNRTPKEQIQDQIYFDPQPCPKYKAWFIDRSEDPPAGVTQEHFFMPCSRLGVWEDNWKIKDWVCTRDRRENGVARCESRSKSEATRCSGSEDGSQRPCFCSGHDGCNLFGRLRRRPSRLLSEDDDLPHEIPDPDEDYRVALNSGGRAIFFLRFLLMTSCLLLLPGVN